MFTNNNAMGFGGMGTGLNLSNLVSMPSETIANQLAPMFAPGPGFQLGDSMSAMPLPSLQSLAENGGPAVAQEKPSFDKILAGLAGINAQRQSPQIQAPQVQAAAAGKSSAIPGGAGDAIIAQLMQNIMATQGARQSIGAYMR